MKRIMLWGIILFMTICCVSCNTGDPQADDGTDFVYIPSFDSLAKSSKALTQIVTQGKSPEFMVKDEAMTGTILEFIPLVNEVKKQVFNKNVQEDKFFDSMGKKDTIFGLDIKLICDASKFDPQTKDLYLYYEIIEGNQIVGFLDYYYDGVNHKFSYKHCVVVYMPSGGGTGNKASYLLLTTCYNDVPVENFGSDSPVFKVGQIIDNNATPEDFAFDKEAFVDNLFFEIEGSTDNKASAQYSRYYFTGKSENGKYAFFVRPDEQDIFFLGGVNFTGTDLSNSTAETVFYENDSANPSQLVLKNPGKVNLEQAISACDALYSEEAMTIVKNHIWEYEINNPLHKDTPIKKYSSIEEFNSSSFSERSDKLNKYVSISNVQKLQNLLTGTDFFDGVTNYSDNPINAFENLHSPGGDCATVINTKNNEAASVSTAFNMYIPEYDSIDSDKCTCLMAQYDSDSRLGSGEFVSEVLNPYHAFNAFYKDDIMGLEKEDYCLALTEAHLKACGIENENYIKNFIEAENSCAIFLLYDHDKENEYGLEKLIFPVRITNENPETWKESLKAYQDAMTQRLLATGGSSKLLPYNYEEYQNDPTNVKPVYFIKPGTMPSKSHIKTK